MQNPEGKTPERPLSELSLEELYERHASLEKMIETKQEEINVVMKEATRHFVVLEGGHVGVEDQADAAIRDRDIDTIDRLVDQFGGRLQEGGNKMRIIQEKLKEWDSLVSDERIVFGLIQIKEQRKFEDL